MNLKNLKVIVTGGAGVIGQELISRLLNIGCSVTCFDIAPKPSRLSQNVIAPVIYNLFQGLTKKYQ